MITIKHGFPTRIAYRRFVGQKIGILVRSVAFYILIARRRWVYLGISGLCFPPDQINWVVIP